MAIATITLLPTSITLNSAVVKIAMRATAHVASLTETIRDVITAAFEDATGALARLVAESDAKRADVAGWDTGWDTR
jgi:hypothetical protein